MLLATDFVLFVSRCTGDGLDWGKADLARSGWLKPLGGQSHAAPDQLRQGGSGRIPFSLGCRRQKCWPSISFGPELLTIQPGQPPRSARGQDTPESSIKS